MKVWELLTVANDYEYISIELEDYTPLAAGECKEVRQDEITGFRVIDTFYTGTRDNIPCTVVIVK